jgi:hypothetical protein
MSTEWTEKAEIYLNCTKIRDKLTKLEILILLSELMAAYIAGKKEAELMDCLIQGDIDKFKKMIEEILECGIKKKENQ